MAKTIEKPSSTAAQACAHIKEMVMSGAYASGMRLTEEQLAGELGTSRTPVREAMRQLVADGFLYFKPNSGTFVKAWTSDEVREIFDLRLLLESEVAAEAAVHIDAGQLKQLRALQKEIEAQGCDMTEANLARISALNRKFHRLLGDASRNTRLVTQLANCIEVPIVQKTFRLYDQGQLARSFHHHRELLDALSARDREWARMVMGCHIRSAKFVLLSQGASDAAGTGDHQGL
ncbi:GntR family transcriptional regulator [Caenimonas soli]|uniref:GntR family transcriptional regulator n=1 Tax=Caenimonas soli TaxID=2735555 RepID=UPI001554325A|nr:GntR family transcriptional regulator [Caenimonas soli]NPC56966.1 GntR family transcriptional regulator [Caenimonas soli]